MKKIVILLVLLSLFGCSNGPSVSKQAKEVESESNQFYWLLIAPLLDLPKDIDTPEKN